MEALFGGSFDPVHVGHLVVAEAVGEALQLAVRFLPAREQPFKRAVHHAAPEQRAWMLGLAVAGNPRFRVERIELDLPAPSYTVRTLRALAEREPGNRFALLLGADAARDLSSWFEVEALPELGAPGADDFRFLFQRAGFLVGLARRLEAEGVFLVGPIDGDKGRVVVVRVVVVGC